MGHVCKKVRLHSGGSFQLVIHGIHFIDVINDPDLHIMRGLIQIVYLITVLCPALYNACGFIILYGGRVEFLKFL